MKKENVAVSATRLVGLGDRLEDFLGGTSLLVALAFLLAGFLPDVVSEYGSN
jgi:hypothetical protein